MSDTHLDNIDFNAGSYQDEEELFKTIYLEFYPSLIVFAKGFVKEIATAEDIVEDVLLKLWHNRTAINAIKNLKLYLFVATKNACLNHLAKHKRIDYESLEDLEIAMLKVSHSPEETFISNEQLNKIQDEINKLPAKCRAIFMLIKEEGLKYGEVADLLNLSVKTIETQMSIALKRLSVAIQHDFPSFVARKQKKSS
jgi:RNA polymerase sigma-70 factor (ECF subfamily)